LTEWNEFRAVDLKQLRAAMRGDLLVDLRNIYQSALAEAAGFVHRGVGRGTGRQGANGASRASGDNGAYRNGSRPSL